MVASISATAAMMASWGMPDASICFKADAMTLT